MLIRKLNYSSFHLVFLFIILVNYIFSFNIFGGFLFDTPVDLLESEILFNKILGEIYLGNFSTLDSLLGGNYQWFYFTRIFFITNFLYSFFSTEIAFILIDLGIKIFAYLSFYKLSIITGNKKLFSFALSACYAYAVTSVTESLHHSVYGFGSSIFPYLTYLVLKKKKLKFRNYFFIIFAAINSHFYMIFSIILYGIFFFFYKKKIDFKIYATIFLTYIFFCILVNSNLLYLSLFNEIPLNRDYWQKEALPLFKNFLFLINDLTHSNFIITSVENVDGTKVKSTYFYLPNFFRDLPYTLIYLFGLLMLFIKKVENYKFFLFSITTIIAICFFNRTSNFVDLLNELNLGIIKSINIDRLDIPLLFLFFFLINNIKIDKKLLFKKIKNFTIGLLILSIIMFQYNKMIIPYVKNKINYESLSLEQKKKLKKEFANFRIKNVLDLFNEFSSLKTKKNYEFLTIKNYYNSSGYSYIKNLVQDNYVLPINIDPAKLIYNNINVLGGLFQFYPAKYKSDFEMIIKSELENNLFQKNYFDKRGHRIYAFVNNPNDIKIDFSKAKLLNAKYVLSSKKLKTSDLFLVCENCNNQLDLNLYTIK